MATRIRGKSASPQGFARSRVEEFAWDLLTGQRIQIPYTVFQTLPVDIDGDGIHELVRSAPQDESCEILDHGGAVLSGLKGKAMLVGKLFNLPGEQVLTSSAEGKLQVWADTGAEATRRRYSVTTIRSSGPTGSSPSPPINFDEL